MKITTTPGIGLGGLMFLVLFSFKLLNLVTFSWWWVCAPLLIPIAIVFVILTPIVLLVLSVWVWTACVLLIEKFKKRKKDDKEKNNPKKDI